MRHAPVEACPPVLPGMRSRTADRAPAASHSFTAGAGTGDRGRYRPDQSTLSRSPRPERSPWVEQASAHLAGTKPQLDGWTAGDSDLHDEAGPRNFAVVAVRRMGWTPPVGQLIAAPTAVDQLAAVALNPATGELFPRRHGRCHEAADAGRDRAEVLETVWMRLSSPGPAVTGGRRVAVEQQLAVVVA